MGKKAKVAHVWVIEYRLDSGQKWFVSGVCGLTKKETLAVASNNCWLAEYYWKAVKYVRQP